MKYICDCEISLLSFDFILTKSVYTEEKLQEWGFADYVEKFRGMNVVVMYILTGCVYILCGNARTAELMCGPTFCG